MGKCGSVSGRRTEARQRMQGWYPKAASGTGRRATPPCRAFRLKADTRCDGGCLGRGDANDCAGHGDADPRLAAEHNALRPVVVLGALVLTIAGAGVVLSVSQRPTTPAARTPPAISTPIPGGPLAGIGFTVADDPGKRDVLLFGGVDNYANTWLWSGTSWTLASPAASPPGRLGASAAYDPETREVMLFGGQRAPGPGGGSLNDTWAWDGTTWQQLDGGGATVGGEGSSMAWDDALNELVLITAAGNGSGGDQTWIWDRTHWSLQPHGDVSPGAFALPMAFDPITRTLIAEGCCYSPASQLGALDTTWRWDGTRWLEFSTTRDPLPGSYLALDPPLGRLVICNCGPMLTLPALASWSGTTWSLMTVAHLPVEPDAEIADSTTGQLLVFGSATPGSQFAAQPVHVWALKGSTWQRLDAGGDA